MEPVQIDYDPVPFSFGPKDRAEFMRCYRKFLRDRGMRDDGFSFKQRNEMEAVEAKNRKAKKA